MRFQLDYGRESLPLDLPDGLDVSLVEPPAGEALEEPSSAIDAALADPIGSKPLVEVARGRGRAVVVISDKTRPVPNGTTLPRLLANLKNAGLRPEQIEILVATGLHRPNTRDELIEMTSREIVDTYRFRNHYAREIGEHVHLGRTNRGTEIWIDRGFVEADLKIVTGLIEPHLMAGFSGGRKAVAPGLAGVDTMRSLHGAAILEDHIGPGIVEDNPLHNELLDIVRRVGVDFMMDVTLDRDRRITGVFAGNLEAAHAAGMRFVEDHVRCDLDRAADIVVTSAGGYPLDETFYQAIKGLTAALNIVRPGGTIILVASLAEGIGSNDFRSLLLSAKGPDDLMQRLQQPGFFQIDQWMLQHLCQVLRAARVLVVSDSHYAAEIPASLVRHERELLTAVHQALQQHGRQAHIAVVPQGPYTLATVGGRKRSLGSAWLADVA